MVSWTDKFGFAIVFINNEGLQRQQSRTGVFFVFLPLVPGRSKLVNSKRIMQLSNSVEAIEPQVLVVLFKDYKVPKYDCRQCWQDAWDFKSCLLYLRGFFILPIHSRSFFYVETRSGTEDKNKSRFSSLKKLSDNRDEIRGKTCNEVIVCLSAFRALLCAQMNQHKNRFD